jgi:succinyl-diaminopimelate desuccinylase
VLDTATDAITLTENLVNIGSVSGTEQEIADAVEQSLRGAAALTVERHGNVVLARTDLRRERRIVLAGHLDTVPIHGNFPARREGEYLYGCGTSDMKSGVAVMLRVAHAIGSETLVPRHDVSWIFYDCEEVEAERNGLLRMARVHPVTLHGDLAVLLEPTDGLVEGGCQGTLRVAVRTTGRRAHSARPWLGNNAIHAAGAVLTRLAEYEARTVDVEGLIYREGLNAVGITGGVAGNVIPDECVVTVNFRYAPDRDPDAAEHHVREVFAGYEVTVVDGAPAARPGLDQPLAKEFVAATGREPRAKYGWTDVARFAELGIPALNFGPGDPNLAHKPEERVSLSRIHEAEEALLGFLG